MSLVINCLCGFCTSEYNVPKSSFSEAWYIYVDTDVIGWDFQTEYVKGTSHIYTKDPEHLREDFGHNFMVIEL